MKYSEIYITEIDIPRAADAAYQHLIDTYASETNKTAAVWSAFRPADLPWKPHPRSATVEEIMKHQLLSERRFFAEFLSHPEPVAKEVLPADVTVAAFTARLVELVVTRLTWLAMLKEAQWVETAKFFDVERQRIWVFWRRILHSAHHRTQLTVYLRLLDRPVPPVYGPTADLSWEGADPTLTV